MCNNKGSIFSYEPEVSVLGINFLKRPDRRKYHIRLFSISQECARDVSSTLFSFAAPYLVFKILAALLASLIGIKNREM
jgi:hypothetical protein